MQIIIYQIKLGGIIVRLNRLWLLVLAFLIMAMFLTSCQRPQEEEETGNSQSGGTSITVNGSTSVQPMAEELVRAFREKNQSINIDVQGGGSGVGIKSANDGIVDIGMSSRELKPEEKNLKEYKIAVDGIAVILNPINPINNLTTEEIKEIYTGEISDWSELGGRPGKITVVSREEGSGTRGAFIELTEIQEKQVDKTIDRTIAAAITQGTTGGVMTTVASDPNAIGYASFGTSRENKEVKMISVNGIPCTEENIYAGNYKIARPFLMLTKTEPTGAVKQFLDYILSSEGQNLVGKHYLKAVR